MHRILRLCFGLHEPVDRKTYLLYGGILVALKYTIDAVLVRCATGHNWTPLAYLSPFISLRMDPASNWLWVALAAWSMLFLWIGVSMTLRRAIDAGHTPWTCLLFFVPLLNWILIAFLCISPPRPPRHRPEEMHALPRLRAALQGIAAGVGVGVVSFALQILLAKSYNAAVFLGTPFTMGAAAGYLYNRDQQRQRTAALGILTVFIAALAPSSSRSKACSASPWRCPSRSRSAPWARCWAR